MCVWGWGGGGGVFVLLKFRVECVRACACVSKGSMCCGCREVSAQLVVCTHTHFVGVTVCTIVRVLLCVCVQACVFV